MKLVLAVGLLCSSLNLNLYSTSSSSELTVRAEANFVRASSMQLSPCFRYQQLLPLLANLRSTALLLALAPTLWMQAEALTLLVMVAAPTLLAVSRYYCWKLLLPC